MTSPFVQLVITLGLDALMALLLVATIFFCARLNKRIKVLQDSKGELASLIRQFNDSTDRAQQSVIELQSISKKVVENMQGKIEKANFLADDLNYMIEKGNKLADTMEVNISSKRNPDAKPAAPRSAEPTAARPAAPAKEQAGINPAASRGGSGVEKLAAATTANKDAAKAKSGTLEAVLEKLGNRTGPDGKPAASARIRSKAEQELLDALKRN